MTTHTVKPREPTVLADQTHYDLLGTDLMLGFKVDTVHLVPGPIDLDRFNDALARTLSVYPVHAGRVRRARQDGQPWRVLLASDGVPVTVKDDDAEVEVPENTIIQSPWALTEGVKIVNYLDHESDEPLLKVTITRFTKTGSTAVGLCSSHLIGDGYVIMQFARLLSQNYQGLPPLDKSPSYTHVPLPASTTTPDQISMDDVQHLYPLRGVAPHLDPNRKKPLRINIRFTATQIAQLHKGTLAQSGGAPDVILSRQDTMIALLAYCLNKAQPEIPPIQHINVIMMSRGIPPRSAQSIGNGLIWARTDAAENPESEDMYSIACRIRKSLIRAKDPDHAAAYDVAHSDACLAAANSEMVQDFLQRPGYMVINSTWRFDWTSAHFGYPGKTRFFHTVLDGPRYVKMFEPNPTQQPDGTWTTRRGDVEITLHIEEEAYVRFKDLIAHEVRNVGVVGEVEFV